MDDQEEQIQAKNQHEVILPSEIIVIDTETTGTDFEKDEVLSLAIVDGDGNELFYELIRPQRRKRWPSATEIHGIRWSDVKDKQFLYEYEHEIMKLFGKAKIIVGYNIDFDLGMLEASGAVIPGAEAKSFCVMKEYAEVHGADSEWKGEKLWCKLTKCAQHYGYKFTPHNALEDAKATAFCYKSLLADSSYIEMKKAEERALKKKQDAEKAKRIQAAKAAPWLKRERIAKKIAAVILVLLSITLFMNSCSIAGGDFFGSLVTAIISVLVFVLGISIFFTSFA